MDLAKLSVTERTRYKLANQDWDTLALKYPFQHYTNCTIYFVGVHHQSPASIQRVEMVLSQIRPSAVCLELTKPKFTNSNTNRQVLHSSRPLALNTNISVSLEFQRALDLAPNMNAQVHFIDEPLRFNAPIFEQVASRFKIRNLPTLPLFYRLLKFILLRDIDHKLQNDLCSIGDMKSFMALQPLVDRWGLKRDAVMATRIDECAQNSSGPIVVVVGKAHVFGIQRYLQRIQLQSQKNFKK
jgi:pheromone shutdown protein TraB